MPLRYWQRETVAFERQRRVEGDKWRSAGAEKKMRSSDKCVFFIVGFVLCFFYILSYECGSRMILVNNNKYYIILFKLNLQRQKKEQ